MADRSTHIVLCYRPRCLWIGVQVCPPDYADLTQATGIGFLGLMLLIIRPIAAYS